MGRKRRRKIGPIKYDVYEHEEGWKERRLVVGGKPVAGLNDKEKGHGPGKPERGRHIHIYLPGGYELKVYLDARWPPIQVKKSRAARKKQKKRRRAS